MVVRNRVTTEIFFATAIKSWLRMSFDTAAAISGVIPGAKQASVAPVASSDKRKSRKSPAVMAAMGEKARLSCVSRMSRVTSSLS